MHIPVLLHESIDGLAITEGDIVLDGTLGGGGHTSEIVKRFGSAVKIIALDYDADAITRAQESLSKATKDGSYDVTFRTIGFQDMDTVINELNLVTVDRILLDLGLSSFQIDIADRGFSFMKDEPLLMTMKKEPTDSDLTAREIVNTWSESTLADIIYGFGEEKYSRKIAKAIVEARSEKSIETTYDLVEIIDTAVGKAYKKMKIHPATRTFQALRIATNSELASLEKAIENGWKRLAVKGRMAIISFHSLEDRIVKRAYLKIKEDTKESNGAHIITKRPIVPSEEEVRRNPRSRSAKLRIIEKL
jgi:16S rRNA (cytosine1402-N4)-methyltransferase